MGSKIKKSIAVVLIATFLMSMFVIAPGAAETENSNATVDTSDYSVSADNSFGELISEKINESGIQSAENENAEGRISELTIEGKTAVVEYESTVDCTILVAIYDETTNQMLASGKSEALKNESTVNVEIVTDKMPEYFIAKAFILNKNNEPLSPAYSTSFYTEAIQKVNNLKATDFEEEKVLNLDDDDNTNFAVYGENTKVIEYKADSNIPVVVDEESGKYVFSNATADLKSLSQGDIFSYNYDGNIIIVKIGTITVDGDTVTITETDTELEEVFDYVKIEMSQGVDECEVGDSSSQGISEYVERKKVSSNPVGSSRSIDKPLDIDPDAKEFDLLNNSVISGKVYFDVGIKGKIYLSFDECYVDFVLDYTIGYSVSINAEIEEKTIKLTELKFRPFAGVKISFVPKLIFSASASIALDMSVNGKIGFGFSTDSGFSNKSSGPSTQSKIKIEGEVYLGVALEPSISVISKKIAVASTEARAGLHFEAELDTNREDDESFMHECKQCASGKLSVDLKLSADLKFFGSKKFHYSKTIFDKSYKLCEFYYSFDYDEFDWTSCPHLKYLVNAAVTKDGVPYPNATVMVYGDRYAENMGETDENGKLSFYLPDDLYVMDVEGSQAGFVVYKKGADVTLDVTEEPTKPTEPDPTEPEVTEPVQDGITWTLDNGVLNIYGSGPMDNYGPNDNYDGWNVASWNNHYSEIVKVNISKGITSIGSYAFSGFKNLKSIIIPDSVKSIGSHAFERCTKLESVNMPKDIEDIGDHCFSNCTRLNNIVIPSKVTSISSGMFYGCKNLNLITLHNNIESIGFSAFRFCTRLKNINIPDSVKSIDSYVFDNCTGLINANLPDSVISMGNSIFRNCTNLEKVTISNSLKSIPDYTFYGCERLTDVIIPDNITIIGHYAFYKCKNLADISIPSSVMTIGAESFAYCTNIKSIEMPDSVTKILGSAFYACNSIESVIISKGVSEICYKAFYGCTNLKEIKISDGVKIIGESAFSNCSSLININMPSSLQKIGQFAFNECNNLKNIYFNSDSPIIANRSFLGVVGNAYYPNNNTWTSDKLDNYGGDITWIPYNSKDDETDNSENTDSSEKDDNSSSNGDSGENGGTGTNDNSGSNIGQEIITNPKSVPNALAMNETDLLNNVNTFNMEFVDLFQNLSVDTNSSIITAEYDNKEANADYIIAVVKDTNAEDILSADNLLYIDQFTSDNDGKISVSLPVSSDTKDYETVLFGPEKAPLKGDVNGDGNVGIDDVTNIQKFLTNSIEFTAQQKEVADVNGDGEINIDDVTYIQKDIVNL